MQILALVISIYKRIWQMPLSKATLDVHGKCTYLLVFSTGIEPMTLMLIVPCSTSYSHHLTISHKYGKAEVAQKKKKYTQIRRNIMTTE